MDKEEADLIITEQNKSTEEILKAVAKIKSDYHELCNLKDMRIAELEEKISVLLSCKNCSENKGGFICVKEYENKCLTQKIQYIKELKEENAELKKEVLEVRQHLDLTESEWGKDTTKLIHFKTQLEKAKEILSKLLEEEKNNMYWEMNGSDKSSYYEVRKQAEQFLKENV